MCKRIRHFKMLHPLRSRKQQYTQPCGEEPYQALQGKVVLPTHYLGIIVAGIADKLRAGIIYSKDGVLASGFMFRLRGLPASGPPPAAGFFIALGNIPIEDILLVTLFLGGAVIDTLARLT